MATSFQNIGEIPVPTLSITKPDEVVKVGDRPNDALMACMYYVLIIYIVKNVGGDIAINL